MLLIGLVLIGLLGILVTVYICYTNSHRHIKIEEVKSADQDDISLYTISTF